MLILLPPSEGKTVPTTGAPSDLDRLAFPELAAARAATVSALVRLCSEDPEKAVDVLGLGPRQADDVARNARLLDGEPAAPARDVYTGVLYDALGLRDLTGDTARRAGRRLAIVSGLWGLLRPEDRIPAYRLGGSVSLPALGTLAAHWRTALAGVVPEAAAGGVVVDLRSSTYEAFWRPEPAVAERTARIRVLHEKDGRRSVVSHHSKATKGLVVRGLLETTEEPRTAPAVADLLSELGWTTELTAPTSGRRPWTLDVVVEHVPTR